MDISTLISYIVESIDCAYVSDIKLVRKDIDVNEHERLSNLTSSHKFNDGIQNFRNTSCAL